MAHGTSEFLKEQAAKMRNKRSHKTLKIASLSLSGLFSASFLMMSTASALSFYGDNALLVTTVSAGCISKPSIFCLFKKAWVKIADYALIASLLGVIPVMVFALHNYFIYVSMSLSVLSLLMHCVLNGKNFKYLSE